MTLKELKQLQDLNQMIRYQKGRLKRYRDAAGIKSPSLSGMPRGNGVHDRIAENIPEAVDLEAEIMKQLEALQEKRNRIESWIEKQPLRIQMIVRLKFLEGCSWNEVADEVYSGSMNPKSEAAVRMYLIRYLKEEEKRNGTETDL